jgi:hypothetical protein
MNQGCCFTFDYLKPTRGLQVFVSQTNKTPGKNSYDSKFDTPKKFTIQALNGTDHIYISLNSRFSANITISLFALTNSAGKLTFETSIQPPSDQFAEIEADQRERQIMLEK